PIAAGAAVVDDAPGRRSERGDHRGAAVRLALQERAHVQRRAVDPRARDLRPERGVGDVVERDVQPGHRGWRDGPPAGAQNRCEPGARSGVPVASPGAISSSLRRSTTVRMPAAWAWRQPRAVTKRRSADLTNAPNRVARPPDVGNPPRSLALKKPSQVIVLRCATRQVSRGRGTRSEARSPSGFRPLTRGGAPPVGLEPTTLRLT